MSYRRHIVTSNEARERLNAGVQKLARIVGSTLSPRGRNVIIERGVFPQITNDGVTIAREITDDDPISDIGIKIAREAAEQTNSHAGDGTTSATILTAKLFELGLKELERGDNVVQMREDMIAFAEKIKEEIKNKATPITTLEQKQNIAINSCQDEEAGRIIGEVFEEAGNDAVIAVTESDNRGICFEKSEGMRLENGFITPYFITNPDKAITELNDVSILVTDHSISLLRQIINFLQVFIEKKQKGDLLIIAEDVNNEALRTIVQTHLKYFQEGNFKMCAVSLPRKQRTEIAEDIAVLTGGRAILQALGEQIDASSIERLGYAKKVTVTPNYTEIIEAAGSKEAVEQRIVEIRNTEENNEENKSSNALRIAKLSGGVAMIKIGSDTDTELRERKLRIEDAIHATKAAITSGIVIGGGATLLHLKNSLIPVTTGEKIVYDSLDVIFNKVVENSGEEIEKIQKEVLASGYPFGFDSKTRLVLDMETAAIFDPALVITTALDKSISAAASLLTVEAVVSFITEEK